MLDEKQKQRLAPIDNDDVKEVVVGYEYVCPGREKHLGLRFQDRPDTAVDGDKFPAEDWEKSSLFLGTEFPFHVAMGLTGRPGAPPGLTKYPVGLDKNESARAELVPKLKAWLLAKPVKARWFVVHDTASLVTMQPRLIILDAAMGIHLFVGLGPGADRHDGVVVQHDLGDPGSGVKFEQLHPEFRSELLHIELNHGVDDAAVEACTEYQYDALVRLYVSASYRAGKWLTVTSHREVDRGIGFPNKNKKAMAKAMAAGKAKPVNTGHWDPRGFDFGRFYKMIAKAVGLPETKTFGILQSRHDFVKGSVLEHLNTFPVQYGPVRTEKVMAVLVPGYRPGVVLNRPAPIVKSTPDAGTTPTTPTKRP